MLTAEVAETMPGSHVQAASQCTGPESSTFEGYLPDVATKLQQLWNLKSNYQIQNSSYAFCDKTGEISSICSEGISNSGLDIEAYGPHSEEDKFSVTLGHSRSPSMSKKVSFSPRLTDKEEFSSQEIRLNAMRMEFRKKIMEESLKLKSLGSPQINTTTRSERLRVSATAPGQVSSSLCQGDGRVCLLEHNSNLIGSLHQSSKMKIECSRSPGATWRPSDKETFDTADRGGGPQLRRSSPAAISNTEQDKETRSLERLVKSNRPTSSNPRAAATGPRDAGGSPRRRSSATASDAGASAQGALPSTLSSTLAARASALQRRTDAAREALLRDMALRGSASPSSSHLAAGRA